MSSELQAADRFFRTWIEEFQRAVEMFSGTQPKVSETTVREIPTFEGGSPIWVKQVFAGGGTFTTWLGLSAATWSELGRSMGGGSADILRSTCLEILSQAQRGTANALGSALGRAITCREPEVLATGDLRASAFTMRSLGLNGGAEPPIFLAVENAAASVLEGEADEQGQSASAGAPAMLEGLLDLQLPISVALGRAEIPIKEVLKITAGSVIELNKEVGEPVDLLVHGSVVARGEIVLLKGNYGVRIEEIVSRRDRLKLCKS